MSSVCDYDKKPQANKWSVKLQMPSGLRYILRVAASSAKFWSPLPIPDSDSAEISWGRKLIQSTWRVSVQCACHPVGKLLIDERLRECYLSWRPLRFWDEHVRLEAGNDYIHAPCFLYVTFEICPYLWSIPGVDFLDMDLVKLWWI